MTQFGGVASSVAIIGTVTVSGTVTLSSFGALNLPNYDYCAVTYPSGTTETYTFKTGGAGGTTVAVVDVVYTSTTKADISTVTKT